jgi:hypothetical protein
MNATNSSTFELYEDEGILLYLKSSQCGHWGTPLMNLTVGFSGNKTHCCRLSRTRGPFKKHNPGGIMPFTF